ncbi:MAG: hypothetical protein JRF63_05500 [Deltaproteobacteria bacterium]|nr:hypothetical protein [Deltaproteobacteria bacterium]
MIRIYYVALLAVAVSTILLMSSQVHAVAIVLAPNPYVDEEPVEKNLGQLYDRIAGDLEQGKPLVATVYVALCDNDSQGIVPVKNRKICDGRHPEANLYWATGGGLKSYLKKTGWKRVETVNEPREGVAFEVVWHKRYRARGELRQRGVKGSFDVYLVSVVFFGDQIHGANIEYLRAVNRDDSRTVSVEGHGDLVYGGASHVVGYIGHDYFFDVSDPIELIGPTRGDSELHKGSFALACAGHQLIRPAITRENSHILLLNRHLAFPGAWTVGGLISGITSGQDGRGIHREAAKAFAKGMDKPFGVVVRTFAHGD